MRVMRPAPSGSDPGWMLGQEGWKDLPTMEWTEVLACVSYLHPSDMLKPDLPKCAVCQSRME